MCSLGSRHPRILHDFFCFGDKLNYKVINNSTSDSPESPPANLLQVQRLLPANVSVVLNESDMASPLSQSGYW